MSLLRSRTGGVGILDLSCPILRLRTFAFVAADEIPDELHAIIGFSESSGPLDGGSTQRQTKTNSATKNTKLCRAARAIGAS